MTRRRRNRTRHVQQPYIRIELPAVDDRGPLIVDQPNATTLADIDVAAWNRKLAELRYPGVLLGALPPATRVTFGTRDVAVPHTKGTP